MNKEAMIEKMKRDRFASELVGIEIDDVAPGWARTRLVIGPQHLNGVGIAQGGALFTLADYAFGVAGNCGDEEVVAIEVAMSFLKPCHPGSTVYAEAKELSRSKRLVSYDIPITNQDGVLIARFSGRGFIREPQPENKKTEHVSEHVA